jgi:hypothetical protein
MGRNDGRGESQGAGETGYAMKKSDPAYAQHAALSPLIGAMGRAVADEALLRRVYTAMGPYAFDGRPQNPEEWSACLDAMRERFGFDDSE